MREAGAEAARGGAEGGRREGVLALIPTPRAERNKELNEQHKITY